MSPPPSPAGGAKVLDVTEVPEAGGEPEHAAARAAAAVDVPPADLHSQHHNRGVGGGGRREDVASGRAARACTRSSLSYDPSQRRATDLRRDLRA